MYEWDDGFSAVARKHAMYPRHYGLVDGWDGHARVTGPCGDTMEFWVSVCEGRVECASFTTDGCGSSRACGSMAVTLCEGKSLPEAMGIEQADILQALGGIPTESEHCALLAATTLRAACRSAFAICT
jgi:nitrogen fixation NifU-like protein